MEIPEDLKKPLSRALSRAELGDLTVREMEKYLSDPRRKSTGFSQDQAQRVTKILREEGILDDKRVLRAMIRRLDSRCFGPRRIREELKKHLFSPAYIEAAMARNIHFEERAFSFLVKLPGARETVKTPEGRKKLAGRLMRAGYDSSLAYGAVKRLCGEKQFDCDGEEI